MVTAISNHKPPLAARRAASKDSRIVKIVHYPNGWVPNSYRWSKPGEQRIFKRRSNRTWAHVRSNEIDMKRSGGHGPEWVCLSEYGGRLASY